MFAAASEFNVPGQLGNARVTSHIPLKDVAVRLTSKRIHRALKVTDNVRPQLPLAAEVAGRRKRVEEVRALAC